MAASRHPKLENYELEVQKLITGINVKCIVLCWVKFATFLFPGLNFDSTCSFSNCNLRAMLSGCKCSFDAYAMLELVRSDSGFSSKTFSVLSCCRAIRCYWSFKFFAALFVFHELWLWQ